jgi:hypothetical protein
VSTGCLGWTILREKIGSLPNVANTSTFVVMEPVKDVGIRKMVW